MEDVASNKRKMKELEDNLLFRLTSTQVTVWRLDCENGDEWDINSVKNSYSSVINSMMSENINLAVFIMYGFVEVEAPLYILLKIKFLHFVN